MSTYPPYGNMPGSVQPPPANHLVWSIVSLVVSTFACCIACYVLPAIGTAITALVFSAKVNTAVQAGDMATATQASRMARLFNLITAGLFVLGLIVSAVMFFAMGGIEAQREQLELFRKLMEESRGG